MNKLMFKLVLMGDSGTGKSALINAYIHGSYTKTLFPGPKIEMYVKMEEMADGTLVNLQVHGFLALSLKHVKMGKFLGSNLSGTSLVLLCYDMNNAQTLQNCNDWIQLIRNSNQKTNICLVGCRSDLPMNVDLEFVNELTKKYKLEFHETTSAKEMKNVNELFHRCAEWCYKQQTNLRV